MKKDIKPLESSARQRSNSVRAGLRSSIKLINVKKILSMSNQSDAGLGLGLSISFIWLGPFQDCPYLGSRLDQDGGPQGIAGGS